MTSLSPVRHGPRRGRWPARRLAASSTVLTAIAAFALLLVGCRPSQGRVGSPTPTPSPPPGRAPAVPPTIPAGVSVVATAGVPQLTVYDGPAPSHVTMTLPNPWLLNNKADKPIPQAFLVTHEQPGWIQILLPTRPNGGTGWVRSGDVSLLSDPFRIVVALSAHKLTVLEGTIVVYTGPAATGAPQTPTPTGHYYIRVLLKTTDPSSVYGPFAYGLSAHSDALTQFAGGDAEIGVHGNNDASVLGQSVTHGCVRMDNGEITKLATILPLGTPVDIAP